MNIWLINHYAVPPKYYPLARQANFAKYLMRKGHKVRIFAASTVHNSDRNLLSKGENYKEIVDDGIQYTLIRCRNYQGNGLSRIYNMCEFALKLPKVCKNYQKPDAIVSTSIPPTSCAVGIRLANKYRCTGVAEIADLWPETLVAYGMVGEKNPITLILRKLEKWIYKHADRIVFFEDGDYEYIKEQGWQRDIPRGKVFCVSNGVDLEGFNYNKEHFTIEDDDLHNPSIFKVVYTGSIRKVNNLGLLLDTAKKIHNPKIQFLIWGNGDELDNLCVRVDKEKIKNVKFKGAVEKKYVPYITSHADMNIVHNSPMNLFRFGISFNKIFDYMAAGKPIICDFNCPFNPVIMSHAGIDVASTDPVDIANAIEKIAQIDQIEYNHFCENATKASQEYDFINLTEKLMRVIDGSAIPIGLSEEKL